MDSFVDVLTDELIKMSDDDVVIGLDMIPKGWPRTRRTALICRVVDVLDREMFMGYQWRYHEGRAQAGQVIQTEYGVTTRDGYPQFRQGRPFTVWVDVPSLANVWAARLANLRELETETDDVPF